MGEHASNAKTDLWAETVYAASLAALTDPRQKTGVYWGYQTRIARNVKELLADSPFEVDPVLNSMVR